ncbi:MAG TPA: FdtA/QdtA family cupin domain-containing protein [Anaerolineales bacterium]|jgi:dTDP-4-dehydrorhamnose 3,5-epimerase-like enzyme
MNSRKCKILELPKMTDPRGNLSFVEGSRHIPFEIQRIFYLYDVPSGARRAGHALRKCQQFIVAMSGSFDLIVDYGSSRERFNLNRSDCGLYIPPMVWREIENFSTNSVCLVLASEFYDIDDYVDVYSDFLKTVGAEGS